MPWDTSRRWTLGEAPSAFWVTVARATVVVEAASGSGALITADAALEQGRDVLAVPGNITSHTSVGTNRLIRDGAIPVLDTVDLLGLYPEADKTDRVALSIAWALQHITGSEYGPTSNIRLGCRQFVVAAP